MVVLDARKQQSESETQIVGQENRHQEAVFKSQQKEDIPQMDEMVSMALQTQTDPPQ